MAQTQREELDQFEHQRFTENGQSVTNTPVDEPRQVFRDTRTSSFASSKIALFRLYAGQAGNSVLVEVQKSAGLRPWTSGSRLSAVLRTQSATDEANTRRTGMTPSVVDGQRRSAPRR